MTEDVHHNKDSNNKSPTLQQHWVLVVTVPERACLDAPRCSAGVSPPPAFSDHNSPLEPAHRPGKSSNKLCTHLESHTEQYTLREVQTEVLSDQRSALLWYLTDFPINNVQCYVCLS